MVSQIPWKQTPVKNCIYRNFFPWTYATFETSLLKSFLANLVSIAGWTRAMSSLPFTIRSQRFDTIAECLFIPVIVYEGVVNHIDAPAIYLQSFINRGFIVPTIIGGPSDLKRILIRVFATDYRLGTLQLTRSGQENRGFMDGRPRNGR